MSIEQQKHYTDEPCDVCGKEGNNILDLKTFCVVCEEHLDTPTIILEEIRHLKSYKEFGRLVAGRCF
jgi:hypothetical protein